MFSYSQLHQNWAQNKAHIEEQIREGETSRLAADVEKQPRRLLQHAIARIGSALIAAGSALQPTAARPPLPIQKQLLSER